MKPIIRITGRAAKRLKDTLTCRARTPSQCLRLVPVSGGLAGLVLDDVRREDEIVNVHGAPVLVLQAALVPVLEGATLDFQDTCEGSPLTLVN